MKTTLRFIYALLLAATLGFKANAQAVDMVLDNPLLSPIPTTYPGTVSFSFDFYAELGSHDLSSDDLAANYAVIKISLGKLDGTGIMPTGPGADLFTWTYNPSTKTYTGKSKDVTVAEETFYKIILSNIPTTQVSSSLDVGFTANLTPPGDLLSSDPNDDAVSIYTNALPGAIPPVAVNDAVTSGTGLPVPINVLANDTQGDTPINPATVLLIDPADNTPKTSVTIVGEGTYTVDPVTGEVTFTPEPGFIVGTSTIQYTVKDADGDVSAPATITVTLTGMPVKLAQFKAAREGKTAQLTWTTTEEVNSDRFEVEHSVNGKIWNRIGSVASKGESMVTSHYNFADNNPANGVNLYRLKMVDKDLTFTYSKIESLKFEGMDADLSVYPNPASEVLLVRDFTQVSKVTITDVKGRNVLVSGQPADGAVNIRSLKPGIYVVRVARANGTVTTHKIIHE